MGKKYKVVGIGEVLWDIPPQGKVLGGAPANFAYHASQLGGEGYIVSAIGKDALGDEIIQELSKYNVNLNIKAVDHPTSTVTVHLDDQGVPKFEINENVAWDYLILTPEDRLLARQTDAVCYGSLAQRNKVSKDAITEFVRNVPESALKICDINLRQHFYSRELIEESIQLSNILKINEDELQIVAGLYGWTGSEDDLCKQLMNIPVIKLLAYTRGADGSYLYTRDEVSFLKTPTVDVADTVGAGDAFTAGLAMGLLNKKDLAHCHKLAVEVSAYVCRFTGAMPGYTKSLQNQLNMQLNNN
jgi:fructokinase